MKRLGLLVFAAGLVAAMGCPGQQGPSTPSGPTRTPTSTATLASTGTSTASHSSTATLTATPTQTVTPSPTSTPTRTATADLVDVVINEADIDNPSVDDSEFIELKNTGSSTVDLTGHEIRLINGSNGLAYQTISLAGVFIAPGDYFVICSSTGTTPGCDLDVSPDMNLMQNGPDAIHLVNTTLNEVVDSLAYGGAVPGAGEGSPAPSDSGTAGIGLSRLPDGQDTGDNSADFSLAGLSPGQANGVPTATPSSTPSDSPTEMPTLTPTATSTLSPTASMTQTSSLTSTATATPTLTPSTTSTPTQTATPTSTNALTLSPLNYWFIPGHGKVVLAGTGFTGVTNVTFSGGSYPYSIDSDTQITVPELGVDNGNSWGQHPPGPVTIEVATASASVSVISNVVFVENFPANFTPNGGSLLIQGSGFTGITSVTIAGVPQTFTVDSDSQITLPSPNVPYGSAYQEVVLSGPSGTSAPHLLGVYVPRINEVDPNQPSTDTEEFVEISVAPVRYVEMAEYCLVFWNGGIDLSYYSVQLGGAGVPKTDGNGLLLVGANSMTTAVPDIEFFQNGLQNGPDAVAIYRGLATNFPNGTPLTAVNLIDALVYGSASPDDVELIAVLLGAGPQAIQVNEDAGGSTGSIQRCALGFLDGRKFTLGPPSPKSRTPRRHVLETLRE